MTPDRFTRVEAVRDDDHVLAIFPQYGHWGAIAKSNFAGLRFRLPVYRSLRELVMSYFEHYCNSGGEKTLRGYSRPVNLSRFDRIGWMTAEQELWDISRYLADVTHTALLTPQWSGASRKWTAGCSPRGWWALSSEAIRR